MILLYDSFIEMFVILKEENEIIHILESFYLNQISLFGFIKPDVEVINYNGYIEGKYYKILVLSELPYNPIIYVYEYETRYLVFNYNEKTDKKYIKENPIK